MTQLLHHPGRSATWFDTVIAHCSAHPFATIAAIIALSAMLKGAGLSLGPPHPVAKRFLTRREQAMLVTLERVLPHCRIHAQVAMGALIATQHLTLMLVGDGSPMSNMVRDTVGAHRLSIVAVQRRET